MKESAQAACALLGKALVGALCLFGEVLFLLVLLVACGGCWHVAALSFAIGVEIARRLLGQ